MDKKIVKIPYYKGYMEIDISDLNISAVLEAHTNQQNKESEEQIVMKSLENPIASERLSKVVEDKKKVLIITSDHTRPVPSKITMPILLEEIRRNNDKLEVKILIATGFHRLTTKDELIDKFGRQIVDKEEIVIHDSKDETNMSYKGKLPSGGDLYVNSLVDWADTIIAEGFIEPHFFAGFSGGRKSVLPGIASSKTVLYNHNSKFIAHKCAKTGILKGNPLHKDMVYAAEAVGLSFILNVAMDNSKKITASFAGDPFSAHEKGCEFVMNHSKVETARGDIVITSNGGYPLDQNIYQAVKGMTAAEECVNINGVIIMIASCCDGHGGEGFYNWFKKAKSTNQVYENIIKVPREETFPDQWEAQILARILRKNKVIMVSDMCSHQLIKDMHMLHANDIEEALSIAKELTDHDAKIVIIPNGVEVIVR